jgi:hypothetical protein
VVAQTTSGEDGAVEPLSVWKVELEQGLAQHDVAGTLELDDGALRFTPDEGEGSADIALGAIARVRRLRLTPVMVIRWDDGGTIRETAYYLARPPPLHGDTRNDRDTDVTIGNRRFPTTRRMQQRRNSTYLADAGTTFKPLLKRWVAAIDEARSGSA